MQTTKHIAVLYHAHCLDGFGSAYAAWKKLGDTADYIPVTHGSPLPQGLEGKEVYIIDFSYPKEVLLDLEKRAKRLVVLDHHIDAQEAVKAVHEHVFDNERSGAGIAWGYFHPNTETPKLIRYIQDGDLWKHELPHSRAVGSFLSITPYTFETFLSIARRFEDEELFMAIVHKGVAYNEYHNYLCASFFEYAESVSFEGYNVLAVHAPRVFRSKLGHDLAHKQPPFGIVWYEQRDGIHCSLRGDGSVDLSEIAQRYGGNGHHNAASFTIPKGSPLPFK